MLHVKWTSCSINPRQIPAILQRPATNHDKKNFLVQLISSEKCLSYSFSEPALTDARRYVSNKTNIFKLIPTRHLGIPSPHGYRLSCYSKSVPFSSSVYKNCSKCLRLREDTSIMLPSLITVKWDTTVFPSGYLSVRDYLAASSSDFLPTDSRMINYWGWPEKIISMWNWKQWLFINDAMFILGRRASFFIGNYHSCCRLPSCYRLCLSISVRTRDERWTQGTDWEKLGRKAGT